METKDLYFRLSEGVRKCYRGINLDSHLGVLEELDHVEGQVLIL